MTQTGAGSWGGVASATTQASATLKASGDFAGDASVSVVGRAVPSTTVDTYGLDGLAKYFNTASSFSLTPQYPTVLARVKIEGSGKQPILSRETDADHGFYLEVNDGVLSAGISLDKFAYITHTHADHTLAEDEWYQVGFKWDGYRLVTILNGKEDSVPTFVSAFQTPMASTSATGLNIGKTYDAADYFEGHISHVRIYKVPYLFGALNQLYQDGAAICHDNLPDWAKEDMAHGWELADALDQLIDRKGSLDLTNNGSATQSDAGLPFSCDPLINILWNAVATTTMDAKITGDGSGDWSSSGSWVATHDGNIVQGSATFYDLNTYFGLNGTRLVDLPLTEWNTGAGTWTADGVLQTIFSGTASFSGTAVPETLSGEINWSASASLKYLLAEISHGLDLDIDSSDKMILNLSPSHTINLTSRVYRAFDETVIQGLNITGDDLPDNTVHIIDFGQSMTDGQARKLSNIISIGHTIAANIAITRQLSSGVGFDSDISGTAWVDVGSFIFPEGRPIVIGCPDAGAAPTLELVGPVSTINLGTPEIGNTVRLDLKIINESSRGGDVVIGTGESIVPDEVYVFSYRKLQNDKDAYQQWLLDNLGEKVTVNWDGESWTGVVLNPETSIVENRAIILDENQNVACPYSGDPYVIEWNITVTLLKE